MSRRRRITALIVGLLLLPSAASGSGSGCSMLRDGSRDMATAATVIDPVHAAHVAESAHSRQNSQVTAVTDDVDGGGSPSGRSHAPTECLSATTCTGVALGVASVAAGDAPNRSARVIAGSTLPHVSPVIGLEPPPPRA